MFLLRQQRAEIIIFLRIEMQQQIGAAHQIELAGEHLLIGHARRQQERMLVHQRELARLQIMAVEQDRRAARKALRYRHQEEMIAMDQIEAAIGEAQRQLRALGDAGANDRLIAMEKGPEHVTQKARRRESVKRRAAEPALALRQLRRRLHEGTPAPGAIRREARQIADRHRRDARAERAIGGDLPQHHPIGAAGMPGRMDDGDMTAGERKNGGTIHCVSSVHRVSSGVAASRKARA